METISHILASFDIFQVFANLFPMITDPFVHAFEHIFPILSGYFKNLFLLHPGISLGFVVFLAGYSGISILRGIQRYFNISLKPVRS